MLDMTELDQEKVWEIVKKTRVSFLAKQSVSGKTSFNRVYLIRLSQTFLKGLSRGSYERLYAYKLLCKRIFFRNQYYRQNLTLKSVIKHHQVSSSVIKCHQVPFSVIKCNSEVIWKRW